MTKAFAYLRVSGKGQVDGDGFKRQLAAITKYATENQITIVQTFREEGVSGTMELENRPALIQLLEALEANGTKLVLIEKLDRLARDLMVQETIIGDIRKRGFDVLSVMEPDLLQNDPTRILMRQVFGAIAQYEKSMIVLKLRVARQRKKASAGRCEGRKPFGFHEEEKVVAARINDLRRSGMGFDRIAERLNDEGYKSRTGSRWHGQVVNRIVTRQPTAAALQYSAV